MGKKPQNKHIYMYCAYLWSAYKTSIEGAHLALEQILTLRAKII